MFKKELWIDRQFINNFYKGSIYDLVFLDLEFWPDRDRGKSVQRIFGYTLTRLLKSNKQQHIKIHLLESRQEEKELIQFLIRDLSVLHKKIFVGFNIVHSDIYVLQKRLKHFKIKPKIDKISVFDLENKRKEGLNRGLNNLFSCLEIPIAKEIDGLYFRLNCNKVFSQSRDRDNILETMYEYCLEDARNYFHIVSNWNNKFPLILPERLLELDLSHSGRRSSKPRPKLSVKPTQRDL